jgi:hypothetical protein
LDVWLDAVPVREEPLALLFRPARTARGDGRHGFATPRIIRRGVQALIKRYVEALQLDPNVAVNSLRVTVLTTAWERGSKIIDPRANWQA